MFNQELRGEVLISLRRIIRAIDLHSRSLIQTHGISGPQALILQQIVQNREITAGRLAKNVHLSKPTISGILLRLEKRGLIQREVDTHDRRQELIHPTEQALTLLQTAPPLLQESFIQRFDQLPDYEKTMILSGLQRIAEMMDAKELTTTTLAHASRLADPMEAA